MQKIMKELRKKTDKKILKQSFFYTYLLGLAAHAYCFLNLTISHDSLRAFYIAGKWPKASMGRIFYAGYIAVTRGKMVLPWLIGILALLWCSVTVYALTQIFQIRERKYVLILAGICVTNPSVYAMAATYIHDLDANFFALLLSVGFVWLWKQSADVQKKNEKFFLGAVGALMLSVALGIYQCFISVAIALVMIYSIRELVQGEQWKNVLGRLLFGAAMVVGAGILYMIEVKIFTFFTGIAVLDNDAYNGLGNLSQVFSGNLWFKITEVYGNFVTVFKNLIKTSDPELFFVAVQGIFCLGIVCIALWAFVKVKAGSKVLLAVLGVTLPFVMNISGFLGNGTYHVLMQYAVWLIYLLGLLLLEWFLQENRLSDQVKGGWKVLVLGCLVFMILENIQTSNTIYVKKDLEAQTTLSFMTRVADRMEENEDYIPGETPVAFIGEYAIGSTMAGFENYEVITGVEYHSPITFYDTYKDYFRYVLGRQISLSDASALGEREEVLEMPVFPKEGSIAMVDGTLVVKLQ